MELNETKAGAICTLIAMGLIACAEKWNLRFGYEGRTIPDDHLELQKYLERIGIALRLYPLDAPGTRPLVIAQTPYTRYASSGTALDPPYATSSDRMTVSNLEKIITQMNAYIEKMHDSAAPKGAYIGGVIRAGACLHIFGPSSLVRYRTHYITLPARERQKAYDEAEAEIEKAENCLKTLTRLCFDGSRTKDGSPLPEGMMFGSVHGMIRAMITVPPLSDNQLYHFEYAMGKGTTKVASCIPCTLFMASYGRSPSATHLGRGDYWNFPPEVSEEALKQWNCLLQECLKTVESLGVYSRYPRLGELWKEISEENIDQLFLESLTFPGKFTDKMINTFKLYPTQ